MRGMWMLVIACGLPACDAQTGADAFVGPDGEPVEIDGISVSADLVACTSTMTPEVGPNTITFRWGPAEGATQYLVRAWRIEGQMGTLDEDDIVFEGTQAGTEYVFPERQSGFTYRLDVWGATDEEGFCAVGGFNTVGPL